jgi:hypothetical protein
MRSAGFGYSLRRGAAASRVAREPRSSFAFRARRFAARSGLALALVIALASRAGAQAAPAAASERAVRLEQALSIFASHARSIRLSTALAQGGIGLVTVVPGVILSYRNDKDLQFLGAGFIVGGVIGLATVPFMLFPSTVEGLYDELTDPAADGGDDAARVTRIEAQLREAARSSREMRPYVAELYGVLGLGTFAVGVGMLLANPGLAGMDTATQYNWGAVLSALGLPLMFLCATTWLQPAPEEEAWDLYQKQTKGVRSARTSFSLAPTRGGGLAAFSLMW